MNKTSFAPRFVRIAARSPGRSRTGPVVARIATPSSEATICASVVFPSPGGPENRIWSRGSSRCLAAVIKICNCSFNSVCPTNSSNVSGRICRSDILSFSVFSGERIFSGMVCGSGVCGRIISSPVISYLF